MLQSTIEKLDSANVIDLYNSGYSLSQLELIVHSDKRTIRTYLLAHGVNVKTITDKLVVPKLEDLGKTGCDLRFNCNKFDMIDTEEKAYWLGFLYADGYVSDDNKLSLGLQAQDVGHLHKFNRFLELTTNRVSYSPKITPQKIYDFYRLTVGNTTLCNALKEKGVIPRKSLVLMFPEENVFSDKSLIIHFIRGYWDGDGCISPISNQINVLGTKEFLLSLKQYLPEMSNRNVLIHKNVFQLGLSGKKAYNLLKRLYENANIYLDRKYSKYLEFCRLYEESYKLQEGENDELWNENIVLTE